MPTKVKPKNLKKKVAALKHVAPKAKSPEEALEETDAPLVAKKSAKPIEIEEEEVHPLVEKPEEVSPFGEVPVEEESEDDASLDEEESNPFGDKWEV